MNDGMGNSEELRAQLMCLRSREFRRVKRCGNVSMDSDLVLTCGAWGPTVAVTAVVAAGWMVGISEMIGWFGKMVVPLFPDGPPSPCEICFTLLIRLAKLNKI